MFLTQDQLLTLHNLNLYTQCCLALGFPDADGWDVAGSVCGSHPVAS